MSGLRRRLLEVSSRIKFALDGVTAKDAYGLLSGMKTARRIWGQHVYDMKAGHKFAGCAACEMAHALGFPRKR